MKLLVWNILQGGGRRRGLIADSITRHAPDVIAPVEFITETAGPLLAVLRAKGFIHQCRTNRDGARYAICVLARTPIRAVRSRIPSSIIPASGSKSPSPPPA